MRGCKLLLLTLFAVALQVSVFAQKKNVILSGKVLSDDFRPLVNATIYVSGFLKGASSDSAGSFSVELKSGMQEISFSYVGYETVNIELDLARDTSIEVLMKTDLRFGEVTIIDRKQMLNALHDVSGVISLRKENFNSLPAFMGENDPMHAVQMQPGVQSGNEGARGIFVRGGSPDQNLMLVDGAAVYNPSHIYGFISVFNGDAIDKIDVYKDRYPARFGGRLCSVMDIRMSEGDTAKLKGSVTLGLVTSRLHLEGPLTRKRKTTFSFSARGCYVGLYSTYISRKQYRASGYDGSIYYYFGDINAKVMHRFSDFTRMEINFFTNNDIYSFKRDSKNETPVYAEESKDLQKIYWANYVTTLALIHEFNHEWQIRHHFSFSRYNITNTDVKAYGQVVFSRPNDAYYYNSSSKYTSHINDFTWREEVIYNTALQTFMFGGGITGMNFQTGKGLYTSENNYRGRWEYKLDGTVVKSTDAMLYAEDEYHPDEYWLINSGFHARIYHVQNKTFVSFLPRVNVLYNPAGKFYLRASASGLSQNLHLLATASSNILNDYWVPATAKAKPETGWNFSAGMTQKLPLNFEWSIDGFYRLMDNLIDYKSGNNNASIYQPWEEQIETKGKGRSYGAEFYLARSKGRITGSVAYTLSWSERKFAALNEGKFYPYKYDRRHNLAAQITFLVGKHFELGAAFVYGSGNRYSLPLQSYHTFSNVYVYNELLANGESYLYQNGTINIYAGKNNARLPAYQHLDVSFTYRKRKKNLEHAFNLSVYNVYNNFNIFSVYSDYRTNEDGSRTLVYKKLSLFPVLPSLSYTIKFMS